MKRARNPRLIAIGFAVGIVPTTCLFSTVNLIWIIPMVVGLTCVVLGSMRFGESTQKRLTGAGSLICGVAVIAPFLLFAYSRRMAGPIRIEIPAGYEGEFSIVKDRHKGQPLEKRDGRWLFRIPEGGVLYVNDTRPFHYWHEESYVYSNGREAVVKQLDSTAGSKRTGPNRQEDSSEFDGTTFRFRALLDSHLPAAVRV